MDLALQLENLESGYGEVQVLWGISLEVARGKLTTIIGTNGAGKTTTLRAIMGSLRAWKGSVLLQGEDVTRLPPHAKANRGLVLVPEGRQLFPDMSVEENLEMGGYSKRARKREKQNLERVYALFPRLKERRQQKSSTLSGGEQQMLALAIAMLHDPQILMIDELSLGLAPIIVQDLLEVVDGLKAAGVTLIIVEQSLNVAAAIADRAVFLEKGRLRFEGAIRDLMERDDLARAVFLGGGPVKE